MPIVAADGFLDAVPITISTALLNVPIPGTPYLAAGNTAATYSQLVVTKNGDWLECDSIGGTTTTATTKTAAIRRPLADIITFTANTYAYGAVRFKKRSAYTTAANSLISFAHVDSPTTNYPILSVTSLGFTPAVDQEILFEWAIDCTTWTIKRRVNGVAIADLSMGTGTYSNNFLAQKMSLQFGLVGTSVAQLYHPPIDIKDVYFGERLAGETSDWLGDVSIVALPPKTITSAWTDNNGNGGSVAPLTALNTPVVDQASLNAPYLVSDAGVGEASLTVDVSLINGKVMAVAPTVIAKTQVGSLAALSHGISADGSTQSSTTDVLAQSMSLYRQPIRPRTPSGHLWTKQKLADMSIKLKAV